MKKKNRISDIISIVLFLAMILGFSLSFAVLPDKESSPSEGRDLQALPSFSEGYTAPDGTEIKGLDYLLHGYLADDFDEYFCDQFPLRNMFLGLSALTEQAFGRYVNNGVLNKDGDLAAVEFDAVGVGSSTEYISEEHIKASLENLSAVCHDLSIPTGILLPPRAVDVKYDSLSYPADNSLMLEALCEDAFCDRCGRYINLFDTMQSLNDSGEQPYYLTDHHWTTKGAYYAYKELMESWGVTPYGMEDFDFVTVTEDFKGTALRNGNYFYLDGEELQLARYEGDEDFTVTELNLAFKPSEEKNGLYDFTALEGEDAYSVFLHGKPTHMSISLEGAERETLLIFKDSFAHSLVPFLARHYDLVIVDMDTSRFGTSVSTVISMVNPNRLLFVYNFENIIETDKLIKLK